MQIKPLSQAKQHLPTIAQWLHDDWGDLAPWADLCVVKQRLEERCTERSFPTCFVAESETMQLLGTASLKVIELAHHPDKKLWLGDVYVCSEYRGKGIGSLLTKAAVAHAFEQGEEEIFLYTPDQQALYYKLGWIAIGDEIINHESATLMIYKVLHKSRP